MDTLTNNKIIDSLQKNQITSLTDSISQDTIDVVFDPTIVSSASDAYSYLSSLWEQINASLPITVIVSIIIFIAGIKINGKIYNKRKKKELELYKSTIDIWWKKGKQFISNYTTSLDDFSTAISTNNNFNIAKIGRAHV